MAHETHALVKDAVLAEAGDTLTVKGFAKPVRTYSVVGLYDDLAEQGRIIRKEQDGLHILLELDKQDRASAIEADPKRPTLIKSVRGLGYKFTADVRLRD